MKNQHTENSVVRGIHSKLVVQRKAMALALKKGTIGEEVMQRHDREISACAEILNPRFVSRKSRAKRTKAFGILGAKHNLKGA